MLPESLLQSLWNSVWKDFWLLYLKCHSHLQVSLFGLHTVQSSLLIGLSLLVFWSHCTHLFLVSPNQEETLLPSCNCCAWVFQLLGLVLWCFLVASISVSWSLRVLCMLIMGQASCLSLFLWTVPLFCEVHHLQSNLYLVHLLVLLLPWFISLGCVVLFLTLTPCNMIGQILDFAWSAYSYNLELVRHLAFRIKRNLAFRLFIDNLLRFTSGDI